MRGQLPNRIVIDDVERWKQMQRARARSRFLVQFTYRGRNDCFSPFYLTPGIAP